jgi:hypothetical protein
MYGDYISYACWWKPPTSRRSYTFY